MDSVCAEKGGFGGQTASTLDVGFYPVMSITLLMLKYHISYVASQWDKKVNQTSDFNHTHT